MRIGFLLGAGVSLPAGMPSTDKLTSAVLDTSRYTQHTNGDFYRNECKRDGSERWILHQSEVALLLEFARSLCQRYFLQMASAHRRVNYEDIYFVVSQVKEHLKQEYENPALEPLIGAWLRPREAGGIAFRRKSMECIAELTAQYIEAVVAIELSHDRKHLNHLQCLVDAAKDPALERCDIFTLNHDLLIEAVLDANGVRYVDGFGPPDNDFRWWDDDELRASAARFYLKLHGSLNWRKYGGNLAKLIGTDPQHAKDSNGRDLGLPEGSPWILIGTANKIRNYFFDPFSDLTAAFRWRLKEIEWLVVSGYGFGDQGVNTILRRWVRRSNQARILILDNDKDGCLTRIRHAMGNDSQDKILVHPKYLCDCRWVELAAEFKIGDQPLA